jgi:hypothetical protein
MAALSSVRALLRRLCTLLQARSAPGCSSHVCTPDPGPGTERLDGGADRAETLASGNFEALSRAARLGGRRYITHAGLSPTRQPVISVAARRDFLALFGVLRQQQQ